MNSDVAVLVEVLAQQVIGVLVRAAPCRRIRRRLSLPIGAGGLGHAVGATSAHQTGARTSVPSNTRER